MSSSLGMPAEPRGLILSNYLYDRHVPHSSSFVTREMEVMKKGTAKRGLPQSAWTTSVNLLMCLSSLYQLDWPTVASLYTSMLPLPCLQLP